MVILKLFSGIYISCLISYSYGFILKKTFKFKSNFYEDLIIGFFVLGIIGLIINFFYPINYLVNNILLLISFTILIFSFYRKKIYKNIFIKIFLISVLSLIIISFTYFQEDYTWYSLPFISLLNFEKISFGISNVQFRFGHISILQYSSAILPNLLLSKDFLILPNLIIPVTFLIWIFNKFILSKKTNSLIANNFLFFVGIFVLTKFTRFAEYGNDVAAHTLVFIILYNFLKIYTNDLVSIEKSKIIFSKILVLSIFVVTQKIQYIMIGLFPLYLIMSQIKFEIFKYYKIILFCSFIFLLWLIKNLINSGCLIFPNELTCFENLLWSANNPDDHSYPKKIFEESSAWSKSWPNQSDKIFNYSDYIKNFNWISTWYKYHGILIIKKLTPFFILSTFTLIYIHFFKIKFINFNNFIYNFKKIKYFLFFLLISILVWFNIFPTFRYNSAFIVSIFSILFSFFLTKEINFRRKELKIIIMLCMIFLCSKNLIRITDSYKSYNIIPTIISKAGYKVYNVNGYSILKPNKGGCYYVKNICSHHGHLDKLSVVNLNNYKFYIYKN